jgi:calcium-dependent protein kinase
MAKVEKGVYSLAREEFKDISNDAKDLIKKMLEYQPEKRVSAKNALAHPWFQNAMKRSEKDSIALSSTALSNLKKLNVIIDYGSTRANSSRLSTTSSSII